MTNEAAPSPPRQLDFEPSMSPSEAVMWKAGDDPWLRPIAGSLSVTDRRIDADEFRRRVVAIVADIPRLRERVAPGAAPWDPPRWVIDPDFDLDYHLRRVALPAGSTEKDLEQIASRWYEDPLDPSRPLWQFVVVEGVDGRKGALFTKIHHSISDGIGLLRMSEGYLDLTRSGGGGARPARSGGGRPPEVAPTRSGAWAKNAVDEVVKVASDAAGLALRPWRIGEVAGHAVGSVRSVMDLMEGQKGGSPLWANRSGRRHVESLRVSLDDVKRVGTARGATVNDVFVTGAVNGVVAYHERHGSVLDSVNFSFVVSQRSGGGVGGNFFTPVRVQLPIRTADPIERLGAVRDAMAVRRTALSSGVSISSVAGFGRLLPGPVLSRIARSQVSGLDFATSNLRGAPVPVYIGGARVLHNTTLGPLAGTPFNLTTISYAGSMDMGLMIDPVAIQDPADLRSCLEEAYGELLI